MKQNIRSNLSISNNGCINNNDYNKKKTKMILEKKEINNPNQQNY